MLLLITIVFFNDKQGFSFYVRMYLKFLLICFSRFVFYIVPPNACHFPSVKNTGFGNIYKKVPIQ